MSCFNFKTELNLNNFQKKVIDNGINLQLDMWNFLVEGYNELILKNEIKIRTYEAQHSLEKALCEIFFDELVASGLSERMVRSVISRYTQAWKNYYNKNMPRHGIPNTHSNNKTEQSLTFSDVSGKINVAEDKKMKEKFCYFTLPVWRKSGMFVNANKPFTSDKMKMKLFEDAEKYFSKFDKTETINLTIKRRKNRYFICIIFSAERKKETSTNKHIGLDWGLKDYFIDSNGQTYNLPKTAERQLQRIKRLQQILDKKTPNSNNYNKVLDKINKAWYRYNCIKKDYIEKLTLKLCRENELICIEDLDIVNLLKNTKSNRRRQIQHNSYFMFRKTLEQKQQRFENCTVYSVDQRFPSSQICSNCGKNTGKKPVSVREFTCPYCGTHHDRDVNAAINILNEGERMANGQ